MNWSHSAAPVVHTSYDYDVPLRETREIRDKLIQVKFIGLFTCVSAGLLQTEMEGNGTDEVYYTQGEGTTIIKFLNGALIYLLGKETAWNFFAVPTTSDPHVTPNQQILALASYLVREASVLENTVRLVGANANATMLEYGHLHSSKWHGILLTSYKSIPWQSEYLQHRWNGNKIATKRIAYGSLIGIAPGAEDADVKLPSLQSWASQDTLPEIQPDYDDSRWTICNKTKTVNVIAPLSLPVLYSSEYSYHASTKIYRGHFDGRNRPAPISRCRTMLPLVGLRG